MRKVLGRNVPELGEVITKTLRPNLGSQGRLLEEVTLGGDLQEEQAFLGER